MTVRHAVYNVGNVAFQISSPLPSTQQFIVDYLQGQFLVASPKLGDPNFFRTVVLMIQHDADGAMGLVLTRPTETTVSEIWQQLVEQELDLEEINEASLDQPIFVGGPVPGQLIAVHDLPDCSETEVMTGLYVATQRATLMRLFLSDARMRLFSGYAGWGEGQLEDELRMGGWLTCPASVDSVLGDPSSLWDEVVRKIGQDILGLDNSAPLPDDPSMN